MSRTLTPLAATTVSILRSDHFTATVETASGSHYTLVARPNVGVVLINDDKGWAIKGKRLRIAADDSMVLFDDGRLKAQTTPIVHAFILSN